MNEHLKTLHGEIASKLTGITKNDDFSFKSFSDLQESHKTQ